MNTQPTAHPLEAVQVEGITRHALLVRGALAAGAVYGASAVSPFVSGAFAQNPSNMSGDIDVLSFALTLEYLEADFYKQAAKVDLGSEAGKLAATFGDEEAEHVKALAATIEKLGGKPPAEPKFAFGVKDRAGVLKLARTLEDTGVSAYNGAAPSISSKEVLAAAGSIVQVEARHAAVIRLLTDETPAPDQFDKPLAEEKVLAAVKPFIRGG